MFNYSGLQPLIDLLLDILSPSRTYSPKLDAKIRLVKHTENMLYKVQEGSWLV